MDAVTVISTLLAAVAALLSAVSAIASWRATRAVEEELRLARASKRHELARSFELDYTSQYPALWSKLGPWEDPVRVDDEVRRVVHDLLQTITSVYLAAEAGLLDEAHARYLYNLFFDWLGTDAARHVWVSVFRVQGATWPDGFVAFIDRQLAVRRPGGGSG